MNFGSTPLSSIFNQQSNPSVNSQPQPVNDKFSYPNLSSIPTSSRASTKDDKQDLNRSSTPLYSLLNNQANQINNLSQSINQPFNQPSNMPSNQPAVLPSNQPINPIPNPLLNTMSSQNINQNLTSNSIPLINAVANPHSTPSLIPIATQQINTNIPPNIPSNIPSNMPPIAVNKEDKTLDDVKMILKNTQSQLQKNTDEIVSLQNKMVDMDFKSIYSTILNIPKIIRAQSHQPFLDARTHYLFVTSADRDLSNTTFTKYNFKVVFGAQSSQTISNYSNTIQSYTSTTQSSNREFSKSTVTYQSTSVKNPNIQQQFKNVISVKLKRVIIPRPVDPQYNPEPVFYVVIDELESNVYTTKPFSNRIFAVVHYDETLSYDRRIGADYDISGRRYLYYTTDNDVIPYYYQSPLARLDRLSIKLVNSQGETLDNSLAFNDTDITQVTGSGTTITASQRFVNNTFPKDRLINVITGANARVSSIATTLVTLNSDIGLTPGSFMVNLSNQVQYEFEVKTIEYDVNSEARPIL